MYETILPINTPFVLALFTRFSTVFMWGTPAPGSSPLNLLWVFILDLTSHKNYSETPDVAA
jgi:hypothetical protein